MKHEPVNISLRLDAFFHKGVQLAIQAREESGLVNNTKTEVIREALSLLFAKRKITEDKIRAALEEEANNNSQLNLLE